MKIDELLDPGGKDTSSLIAGFRKRASIEARQLMERFDRDQSKDPAATHPIDAVMADLTRMLNAHR